MKKLLLPIVIIFAIAPFASILQGNFDIPISGIPEIILQEYVKIRDGIFYILAAFFSVIQHVLSSMPSSLKDLVSLYIIGFSAWLYTSRLTTEADIKKFSIDKAGLETDIKQSAKSHGINPEKKWLQVQLGVYSFKFRWLRHLWSSSRWPLTLYRNSKQAISGSESAKLIGRSIAGRFWFSIILTIIGSGLLLFWGYLDLG